MDILHEKLALLMENIKAMGSVAVAFSGGVDSTFLMKAAHKALGDKAVAVTARSHAISEREWKEAEELAKAEGIRHVMFDFPECDLKEFAQNPPDRCYYCKTVILRRMWEVAKQEGIAEIVEGSNADDESDYRPGMRAVKEQKVKSPLKAVRSLSFFTFCLWRSDYRREVKTGGKSGRISPWTRIWSTKGKGAWKSGQTGTD